MYYEAYTREELEADEDTLEAAVEQYVALRRRVFPYSIKYTPGRDRNLYLTFEGEDICLDFETWGGCRCHGDWERELETIPFKHLYMPVEELRSVLQAMREERDRRKAAKELEGERQAVEAAHKRYLRLKAQYGESLAAQAQERDAK